MWAINLKITKMTKVINSFFLKSLIFKAFVRGFRKLNIYLVVLAALFFGAGFFLMTLDFELEDFLLSLLWVLVFTMP